MTRRSFYSLGLILLLMILSACGFKLRGALELSSNVAPVYIENGGLHELSRVIRSMLEQNDIAVLSADDQSQGQYQSKIRLDSEARQRRVLSVDGSGRASEYLLIYKLTYALSTKTMPEETYTLQQQRSLVFEPSAVLAVENQASVLYQDMQKDAARLILLKLQAVSRSGSNQDSTTKGSAGQSAGSSPESTTTVNSKPVTQ